MNNNLLILGAGGHGRVVKDTAEAMSIFDKIDFLDDNPKCGNAIGLLDSNDTFKEQYSYAFPAFGDNKLRMKWIDQLEKNEFIIPALIHPTAYVSPYATVHPGTIIEANAVVNANSVIEKGCIIGIGVLIDHDTFIGCGCHIDCGAVIKSICTVGSYTKVECGGIITNNI